MPEVFSTRSTLSYRKYPASVQLAELLAQHFTVFNYDRRGRGDSGDTKPYAVEREIEDVQALIDAAGGSACVWGLSSGAILALKAAASGLAITKLALQEPPLFVTESDRQPPKDFIEHITDLITSDRRDEAVKYFMTKGMGAPGFVIPLMHLLASWRTSSCRGAAPRTLAHAKGPGPYQTVIAEADCTGSGNVLRGRMRYWH